MSNLSFRTEEDSLGSVLLPPDALYGGQTQRTLDLYPTESDKTFADYPALLQSVLLVKKISAIINQRTGELPSDLGEAIVSVIEKLLAEPEPAAFPVHALHGGGGIAFNMNVNEVIANVVNRQAFGQPLGSYQPIHPNDHVNLNHSTSDTLNTATHLALINTWSILREKSDQLFSVLEKKRDELRGQRKIARTCLQDAVDIDFAEMFSGYSSVFQRRVAKIEQCIEQLYEVSLGANIIGRSGDSSPAFLANVEAVVREVLNEDRYQIIENFFDATQNSDNLAELANQLEGLAHWLMKFAKDLRLMASGPETGFMEIQLPSVQPGSSALPGKVNPAIPEFLIQCCMVVSGKCHTVRVTQQQAELDYSPWIGVITCSLLDAMHLLQQGMSAMADHCVADIETNAPQNQKNIHATIPTLVKLKQQKGYVYASRVYKESKGNIEKIRKHLLDD